MIAKAGEGKRDTSNGEVNNSIGVRYRVCPANVGNNALIGTWCSETARTMCWSAVLKDTISLNNIKSRQQALTEVITKEPKMPNSALSISTVYLVAVGLPVKLNPVSCQTPDAPSPLVVTVATEKSLAGTA
jgi:hypothetical protein